LHARRHGSAPAFRPLLLPVSTSDGIIKLQVSIMSQQLRNAAASLALALATLSVPLATSSATAAGTSRSCLTSAARALLGRIEAKFGSVQIVSTCRPGATIAGTGRPSRHASGNAIDFRAPGRKGEIVRWLIANHKSGGVMTYAGMDHIHVDIGPRFVSLR
jgi:hypothetical protein